MPSPVSRLLPACILLAACGGGGGGGTPPPPLTPRLSFAPPQPFAIGANGATRLQVADLNRDGKPDLLTSNRSAGSLSVLMGAGAGLLAPSATYLANSPVAALATADLDGDRIVDMVDGSDALARVTVRHNDGFGVLTGLGSVALSQPIRDLALAEVTGDGKPDLLACGTTGGALLVLPGDGANGFGVETSVAVPRAPHSLRVADFTGDGLLDAAMIVNDGSQLAVLRGTGTGFALPVLTDVPLLGEQLVLCDFDADGVADLLAVAADGLGIEVLRGNGAGSFVRGTPIAMTDAVVDIAAADLDNDGAVDVILATGTVVQVAYGDRSGTFAALETVTTDASGCAALISFDLDGNGLMDLAYVSGGNFVTLLKNPKAVPLGVTTYGLGTPDCLGTIGITANVKPSLGISDFAYVVTNAPPRALGMLMMGGPGLDPGLDAFGLGFLMHVGFDLLVTEVLVSDHAGGCRTPAGIPASAGLTGLELFVQTMWMPNPGRGCSASPLGLSTSRGLRVVVQD